MTGEFNYNSLNCLRDRGFIILKGISGLILFVIFRGRMLRIRNNSPVISISEDSSIELQNSVEIDIVTAREKENNRTKSILVQDEKDLKIHSNYNNDIQKEEILIQEVTKLKNLTDDKNEDIPSFSEWAQKRLEEVEKKEEVNSSKVQISNGKGSNVKLRWKNYASLDCGAKVIAANPESISPGAILSPSSDEYKLNPCTSRIWFIVELCEAIQTKKIDLANYELFSSSPKDFTVSVSDRYPTREWSVVGRFTAKDERDIQSFDLDTNIFGKYVKVEIKSHYGSEHYCPISLFRAYGTSVFEVLQKEDPAHINRVGEGDEDNDVISNTDDDDDHDGDIIIIATEKESEDARKNLFSSATDAVISIVKRAAEVLGNKANNQTIKGVVNGTKYTSLINKCRTPNYVIYCKNCDGTFFDQIYELVSCETVHIRRLVRTPLIYKALSNSVVCQNYDYEYNIFSNSSSNLFTNCITSFFPPKYIGAMCNEISILENRGVLNNSQHFSNVTGNFTNVTTVQLKIQKHNINTSEIEIMESENINETKFSIVPIVNSTFFDTNNVEDITYGSQIKPTKPLLFDTDVGQTNADLNITSSSEITQTVEETSPTKIIDTFSSNNLFERSIELSSDMEVISDGMDMMDDHLDFMSELNADYTQNPSVMPTTATTANSPQAQKESIFLRLSNRIKTLERNMSLSSQYLEELSRRYKKQVEEIQNLLEKTVTSLREESFKKDLRNKQLEDRLDNLTAVIESLIDEKHSWFLTMYWVIFSSIFVLIMYFFCRNYSFLKPPPDIKKTAEVLYGKPVNYIVHNLLEKQVRRPSDQALNILHCSKLIDSEENASNQKSKKRKKKHPLRKSNSISNIKDDKCHIYMESEINLDWVENGYQITEDTPYVLDESDHSALETFSLENNQEIVETPNHIPSSFNLGVNKSPSQFCTNEVITVKSNLDNSWSKKQLNNDVESTKREKKSLKKLLKKVF